MQGLRSGIDRRLAGIPPAPNCASCGIALAEPFGWCSNCAEAYCLDCGRQHYCTEGCRAAGCIVGLCVRRVDGGLLSTVWERPAESSL
jgi:hypothetical protein